MNLRLALPALLSTLTAVTLPVVDAQDVLTVVVNSPNHTILETAFLAASDAADALSSTDVAITLFAPTDAAFGALPDGLVDQLLEDEWNAHLFDLLAHHVIIGDTAIPSSAVTDGTEVETAAEETISFSVSAEGVITIDQGSAAVIAEDIDATNGIVHVTDGVIIPDWISETIVDVLVAENFTTLVGLAQTAGLVSVLSGPGPFTLFAPTDAAFATFVAENPDAAGRLNDPDFVAGILRYHVAEGIYSDERNFDIVPGTITNIEGAELQLEEVIVNGEVVDYTVDGALFDDEFVANNGVIIAVQSVIVPPPSVLDIATSLDQFSTLVALASDAGLATALDTLPNITVFAPDNDAFAELPDAFVTKIRTDQYITHLKSILLYHIVQGEIVTSSMITDETVLSTMATFDLTFAVNASTDTIVINDSSEITVEDIAASNPGVVHVINSVLTPPWVGLNIVEVATAVGGFDTLLAIATDDVAALLTSDTPHTVFAPPDTVFQQLQAANPELTGVFVANPNILADILGAHVVEGVVTAEQLSDGENTVTTISGEELTVVKGPDGITVNGIAVVQGDVLADNGVIHVIGGLITPAGLDLGALLGTDAPTPMADGTMAPTMAPTDDSGSSTAGMAASAFVGAAMAICAWSF